MQCFLPTGMYDAEMMTMSGPAAAARVRAWGVVCCSCVGEITRMEPGNTPRAKSAARHGPPPHQKSRAASNCLSATKSSHQKATQRPKDCARPTQTLSHMHAMHASIHGRRGKSSFRSCACMETQRSNGGLSKSFLPPPSSFLPPPSSSLESFMEES